MCNTGIRQTSVASPVISHAALGDSTLGSSRMLLDLALAVGSVVAMALTAVLWPV